MAYTQEQSKTVLFSLLSVFVVVLVIGALYSTRYISNASSSANTVVFSGEGKVSAKPDVAIVNFSIVTTAKISKDAQNANSKKSNAVTDYLKKQDIADKDIKTTSYTIQPQYSYPRPYIMPVPMGVESYPISDSSEPKITGYQVTQSFEVKIHDTLSASKIVDGLVTVGASQVGEVRFDIENSDAIKSEARAKAIAEAKKKADTLTSQVGIRLGKIVNFEETSNGYPGPMAYMKAEGMGGGGSTVPSLPTGENEITVSVSITYQIK